MDIEDPLPDFIYAWISGFFGGISASAFAYAIYLGIN